METTVEWTWVEARRSSSTTDSQTEHTWMCDSTSRRSSRGSSSWTNWRRRIRSGAWQGSGRSLMEIIRRLGFVHSSPCTVSASERRILRSWSCGSALRTWKESPRWEIATTRHVAEPTISGVVRYQGECGFLTISTARGCRRRHLGCRCNLLLSHSQGRSLPVRIWPRITSRSGHLLAGFRAEFDPISGSYPGPYPKCNSPSRRFQDFGSSSILTTLSLAAPHQHEAGSSVGRRKYDRLCGSDTGPSAGDRWMGSVRNGCNRSGSELGGGIACAPGIAWVPRASALG